MPGLDEGFICKNRDKVNSSCVKSPSKDNVMWEWNVTMECENGMWEWNVRVECDNRMW